MSIEFTGVGKTYPGGFALDDITFGVDRGTVVGFLGPNGAGKSTTLRLLLGLEEPDQGTILIDQAPYVTLARPLTVVGALIDTGWINTRQTGRAYLRWVAASNGIDAARIPEVLDLVGMTQGARKPVGRLSLGMKQRLGLAAALLGDPDYLVFDEPLNGLDPEGIIWMRTLIEDVAAAGKGVLLSSHVLAEVAKVADQVVMIADGSIRGITTVDELAGEDSLENAFLRSVGHEGSYRGGRLA